MKSETSKHNEFDSQEGFEIREPLWAFWVCLLATISCFVVFFVFCYLKAQNKISADTFSIGYIFFALALLATVGLYAWIYEKLTYFDGVYKYYNAFGKDRSASVSEIASVKILTVYHPIRYGGVQSKIRIFFYDKDKGVLIKIIDDGTLSKNETFIKSLKYNRIKIIREEKYDY